MPSGIFQNVPLGVNYELLIDCSGFMTVNKIKKKPVGTHSVNYTHLSGPHFCPHPLCSGIIDRKNVDTQDMFG